MQGKKHYQEKLFTQFSLSEKVPEHNFYRRLKEVLDLRWLYKRTKKYYGSALLLSSSPCMVRAASCLEREGVQRHVSVKPGKPRQLNYHAQVSVDTASHIITNMEAHGADKKDSQCLPSILLHTIKNLTGEGLIVEELLADAGYSSGEALKALEQNNIIGYIPNFGQYKNSREGFSYNKEGDYYQCSRGVKLPFKRIKDSHEGAYRMRVYRSSSKDCGTCPLRSVCIGKSDFKKIEDTVDKPYYDRMHERLQTAKAKRMKKIRSSTVEPVLGTLVNFLAMRRVNTRGLGQANKCMLMAAVAYNLKKLLNYKAPKVMADVKRLKEKAGNCFLNCVFWLQQYIVRQRMENIFQHSICK